MLPEHKEATSAAPLRRGMRGNVLPRRPRQARAHETVQALLDAADALVQESGADALVMRVVARRASVKPATLYDYFPTKDLLVRALEDRAWARAAERARAAVEARRHAPLGESIAAIVEIAIGAMVTAQSAYGLTAESPFGVDVRRDIGQQFASLAVEALGARVSEVRVTDLRLQMVIATKAVALLTWAGARDHADALRDGSYAREVGSLIARYLVRDP